MRRSFRNGNKARNGNIAFLLFFILISALLLEFGRHISMMNQADYGRTIGFMLGAPLDVVPYTGRANPAFLWPYVMRFTNPLGESNSASVYFWLLAKLQSVVSTNFDLHFVFIISALIVLVCCGLAAIRYSTQESPPNHARYVVFPAFALAFFYAHNIALLNSLYAEHAFVVGIAILLAGVFHPARLVRIGFIATGLLLAAASKPQFFYLPILFAVAWLTTGARRRAPLDTILLCALAAVQALSFVPLLNATTKQVNYYHSLYFGSYKLLTSSQLVAIGAGGRDMECVGIDAWGWKMIGQGSTRLVSEVTDCQPRQGPITLKTVLKPYLKYPFLLVRLALWSLPDHFTVHYFELNPTNTYFRPSDGIGYHDGAVLIAASNLREATVTRFWAWIVLAGMLLPLVPGGTSRELRSLTLFLALAVPTQIVMCLVGEGVRDLSKHLAGAQLCLDILSVICALHLLGYLVRRFR